MSLLLLALLALLACTGREWRAGATEPTGLADVVGLRVEGEAGAWRFWVSVRSPDRDCRQWSPFWEVVDEHGRSLLYRRTLAHSHAEEQPFTRAGGPVPVGAEDVVVVRALMAPGGYGGQALRGSVAGAFEPVHLPEDFGAALLAEGPQAEICAF